MQSKIEAAAVHDKKLRHSLGTTTPVERLAYIAEMLDSLEQMAVNGGHATLASILQIAYAEARQELDGQN